MSRSVRQIFDCCLEQPSVRRMEYLDTTLGPGEQHLKQQVLRLLASHEAMPGHFLSSAEPARHWPPGQVLGVYKVIRHLGQGGMGVVYEVCRNDGVFEKRFALKVLANGQLTATAAFHSERRLLALVDHPLIARIVDGGTTPEGSPYLVMDIVDGVPIDQFDAPSQQARLVLLASVCDAVAHLHEKGIVHGDLKPANILVDTAGVPRLLDFGIARLTRSASPMDAPAACTPSFAAPEQLTGQLPLPASDVFSLGIVAFLLLTGKHPFAAALAARNVDLLRQTVTTTPCPKAALAPDLDAIIAKAAALRAADRYPSARELRDDLNRFLSGHPVHAHPGGLFYRTAKLIRRQRIATVLTAALAAALAAAVVVALDNQQLRSLESSLRSQAESQLLDLPITPDASLTVENIAALESALTRYRARIARSWFGGPGLTAERRELITVVNKYLTALERSATSTGHRYLLARLHFELANLRGYPHEPNLGDPDGAADSYRHTLRLATGLDDQRIVELHANATSRLTVVNSSLQKRGTP